MTQKKVVRKNTKTEKTWANEHPSSNGTWSQPPPNQGPYYYPYPPTKLYKSTRNKWLGGVCGGIAEYYNKDPMVIRLLWILVTIVSVGIGVVGYIIFWAVLDKDPTYYSAPPLHYHYQTPDGSVHYHYHERSH